MSDDNIDYSYWKRASPWLTDEELWQRRIARRQRSNEAANARRRLAKKRQIIFHAEFCRAMEKRGRFHLLDFPDHLSHDMFSEWCEQRGYDPHEDIED